MLSKMPQAMSMGGSVSAAIQFVNRGQNVQRDNRLKTAAARLPVMHAPSRPSGAVPPAISRDPAAILSPDTVCAATDGPLGGGP